MKDQSTKFKLNLQLFAENEPTPPEEKRLPSTEDNYLEELKTLKENSVPKEEYLRVVEDHKRLLKEALNGETPMVEGEPKPKAESPTIDQLKEDLYIKKNCKTNLEYFKKTLQLRDEIIAQGRMDPFVPVGHDMTPEARHFETAAKIAEEIKSCIEASGDDPEEFNRLLDKKIIGGLPKHK